MSKLKRKAVIFFNLEDTYNNDPGFTAANDAVLVFDPSWAREGLLMHEQIPVKSTYGKNQAVYGGELGSVTFTIKMKGSGTAGTAPEHGKIMKALGFSETIVSSTSVTYLGPSITSVPTAAIAYEVDGLLQILTGCAPTSAAFDAEDEGKLTVTFVGHKVQKGTAAVGAAATITLGTAASAVDDTYNGQTIEIISGTGSGQINVITDYVGSTKVATVTAWTTVPDNTSVYKILGGPIDRALPSASYIATLPPPFVQAAFSIGGYSAVISKVSIDLGIESAMPKDVNSPDKYGTVQIIGGDVSLSIDPEATTIAVKDWEKELREGTVMALDTGVIGETAGNKWKMQVDKVYTKDNSEGDRDGILTNDLSYGGLETTGDDIARFIFT